LPEAKGLLWVASDNSAGMDPDVVWYLLRRILQKRKPTGELAYSSLHGLAYFNPRVPAKYVGGPEPLMFWFSGPRQTEDAQMTSCLLRLHEAWLPYLASSTGIRIRRVEARPEQVRFSDDKTSLTVGGKYD